MKQGRSFVAAVLLPALLLLCSAGPIQAEEGPSLRSYLERGHCRNRSQAQELLGKLGPATPGLKARLRILMARDSDPTVRECAVSILAALDDRPPQSLARLLMDEDKGVREAAIYALSGAGTAAVDPVGEVLLSAPCRGDSAEAAVRVLWQLRSGKGVPYLAGVLRDDTGSCAPREGMLQALEAVKGPAGVRAMFALIPYRHLTEEIYVAFSKFWKPDLRTATLELMNDPSEAPEQRMVYALNFNEIFGTSAARTALVGFFEEMAQDPAVSPETREAAAGLSSALVEERKILHRRPLDERRARELANNPRSRVETVLMSLGVRLPQSAEDFPAEGSSQQALAELLLDEDRDVRAAAAEALLDAGREVVGPVGEILRSAPCDSEAAGAAARVLGEIGDDGGAPYLADVLIRNREGCFPQEVGLQALKEIGGPEAVRVLLTLVPYHETARGAYLVFLEMDRQDLRRDVVALMNDPAEAPELRMSYALTLNEILGTRIVRKDLVKFFEGAAQDPEVAAETRKAAAGFAAAFAEGGRGLFVKPLTRTTAASRADELRRGMEEFGESHDRGRDGKEAEADNAREGRMLESKPPYGMQIQDARVAYLRTRYMLRQVERRPGDLLH